MSTISLIAGGSRGLGRNTALSIARHGGDVILTYRSASDDAQAVVVEIERMDFDDLINNACHGEMVSLAETKDDQFDSLFNVHVKGTFF